MIDITKGGAIIKVNESIVMVPYYGDWESEDKRLLKIINILLDNYQSKYYEADPVLARVHYIVNALDGEIIQHVSPLVPRDGKEGIDWVW